MYWPCARAVSTVTQVRVVEAVKVLGLMYLVFIVEVCTLPDGALRMHQIKHMCRLCKGSSGGQLGGRPCAG